MKKYSIREAADYIGKTYRSMYVLRSDGSGPRTEGTVYTQKSLDEWLAVPHRRFRRERAQAFKEVARLRSAIRRHRTATKNREPSVEDYRLWDALNQEDDQ